MQSFPSSPHPTTQIKTYNQKSNPNFWISNKHTSLTNLISETINTLSCFKASGMAEKPFHVYWFLAFLASTCELKKSIHMWAIEWEINSYVGRSKNKQTPTLSKMLTIS